MGPRGGDCRKAGISQAIYFNREKTYDRLLPGCAESGGVDPQGL